MGLAAVLAAVLTAGPVPLFQVLFACAEALHAHGYSNEACRLAVELAGDLLANPPDLKVEQPQTKVTRPLLEPLPPRPSPSHLPTPPPTSLSNLFLYHKGGSLRIGNITLKGPT